MSIDQEKAGAFGLSLDAINADLSAAWGGKYVNDFVDRSRVKKVYVQADAPFRMKPEDFNRWYFRNDKGEMVPFTSIGEARWTYGPMQLERYNGVSAVRIQGRAAAGMSSGTAMLEMERLMKELPEGIGYQWTGMSFQERLSGSQAPFLYALSILVVFLCLAALYESWSIPLSVVLVVPLGVLGAVAATRRARAVQRCVFPDRPAGDHRARGEERHSDRGVRAGVVPAGREPRGRRDGSGRLRLRPILMTSLAFLIGVLPLAISTGRGREARMPSGPASWAARSQQRPLGFSLSRSFSSWSSACSTGRLGKAGEPPFRRGSVRKSVRLDFGATGGTVKIILYCPTRYAGGVSWN